MPMLDGLAMSLGGLIAFSLALFGVGRAMRADAAKRIDAYTTRLEQRVRHLERQVARGERRRYQLEGILRAAGLPVPPWPAPDDETDPDAILTGPRSTP